MMRYEFEPNLITLGSIDGLVYMRIGELMI